jgi:hypothetical protein
MRHRVMIMTTDKIRTRTWQAVSLHWRNTAEGETRMTKICATSSAIEMHVAGSKADIKSASILIDYDYYGPYYDQPHRQRSLEGVKAFSQDLKRVRWPLNFKPLEIEKYDGSTNPVEWLKVYQLAIEATGGDSYIMSNYLSVCLSSSNRTWLLGLPVGSLHSWSHLCRMFTSNFHATCAHPGVDWDLASVVQKKGESLWEFI